MFVSKRSRFSPTLLCYLTLVLALASATQAINLNPPNHAQLSNRMIKKRGTIPLADVPIARGITLDPLEGAGAQPPSFSGSASSTAASASQSAIASSATPTSAPAASSTPLPSSDSGSASSQPSSAASATPSSDSLSSASTSGSSSASSSVPPSSASTPSATPSPAGQVSASNDTPAASDQASNTSKAISRVTATVTDGTDASQTAATVSGATSSTKVAKTTIIVIAAVAASIGGIFVLWTIIRKWKFKPSADFEDRMQPIDWQPTTGEDNVPGLHRNGTAVSHGSFHSGSGHGDDSFGSRGAYGSDHGHNASPLQPIPDHDFTAGAPSLAPVGGYADLARGPSPGPQMAQLNRGPSTNRPEYESYGVPLHHQNAYGYNGAQY